MTTPIAPERMLRVSLSIEGELVIDRLLQGIEERARDMTPVWPEVVRVFREIVKRAFESEGASTGEPWQQLAESTQRDRQAHGFPPAHPILERTGALLRSLVIGSDGGYVVATPSQLEIGSDVEYLKYHQSNLPRKRLPRRAPINLTADDRVDLMRPIRLYLTARGAYA
jgi:phage gpG-like protein